MLKIQTKILNPMLGRDFPLPTYATNGSAGIDMRACISEEITLEAGETRLIPSGMAININDSGYTALMVPRSGLGIKKGIVLGNLCAVIDSDYHGEVGVGLWNRSKEDFIIEPGERICQMLFVPVIQAELVIVSEFSGVTERGVSGFGSTGRV